MAAEQQQRRRWQRQRQQLKQVRDIALLTLSGGKGHAAAVMYKRRCTAQAVTPARSSSRQSRCTVALKVGCRHAYNTCRLVHAYASTAVYFTFHYITLHYILYSKSWNTCGKHCRVGCTSDSIMPRAPGAGGPSMPADAVLLCCLLAVYGFSGVTPAK